MAMTQKEMMPEILGILLHTDKVLNVGDLYRQTRFNHDKMILCLQKLEKMGLVEVTPAGFGFNSITVVQAAQSLFPKDND